jgi:hypothetical protein
MGLASDASIIAEKATNSVSAGVHFNGRDGRG